MNDLSIRVTAADMASNVLASVGENVRGLGQTASSAFDSMAAAGSRAAQQAQGVASSNTVILAGGAGLGVLAKVLTTVAGAGIAAASAVAGLGVAAISAAEKARREVDKINSTFKLIEAQRLNVSVDLVGKESIDMFSGKVKSLADDLENITGQKSGKFMALGKDALMAGIDPAKIDQAIKAATGLSYAFGTSLEGGLTKAQQAMKGNFDGFEALIPGIEQMATSEQKLAAVNKLATDAMKMQADVAKDSIGIFSRFSTGFGNMLEKIGSGRPLIETFSGSLADMVFPAIEMFDQKIFKLGTTADGLKDAFKTTMAYVATVVELYTDQASLSFQKLTLQINLSIETALSRAKFMFTSMPAYAEYLKNLLTNMGSLFDAGAAGPGAFFLKNDALTPEALKKGPEKSVFEKQLEEMLTKINQGANREFDAMLKQNLDKINEAMAKSKQAFEPKLTLDAKKIEQPAITVDTRINQALESRVMVRGPLENAMDMNLASSLRQEKLLEEIRDKKIADEAVRLMQGSNTGFFEIKMID